jgi:DNA-directed RNA polymerase specialized sigma24 family protein
MSAKPTTDWHEDLKQIVTGRFPEGLVRMLERRYPGASSGDYEDAVATGFEKLAKKGPTENPKGYVTTVAKREALRHAKLRADERLARLYDNDDGEHEDESLPRGVEWDDPVHDEVVRKEVIALMREIAKGWENRNLKQTTLLIIEALEYDEPIENADLTERLNEILGDDFDPATVRQWRKRGLDRLRNALIETDHLPDEETKS